MFKQTTVYKLTQDDWFPSVYSDCGDLVFVSFHGNIHDSCKELEPVYRTSVWGGDDTGMEFDSTNEAESWTVFLQVIGLDYVNMRELSELGFKLV